MLYTPVQSVTQRTLDAGSAARREALGLLALLWLAPAASAATGYTALSVQLSTDDIHWSSGLQVTPGSRVSVRIVGAYEGRAAMHGLAWVNFQPVISNWYGTDDRVLPFVASGNQQSGQVAFDKPEPGQAAYGRVFPFASNALGPSAGGFDTTLVPHVGFVGGDRVMRLAQARTTNDIGQGPATGLFAFNNTNGAGGVTCAQTPSESGSTSPRSSLIADVVLFKFGITIDSSLTDRLLPVQLPLAGISKFGTASACAGWFTTADQTAAGVAYVPVYTRDGLITVRGSVPGPGAPACLIAAGAIAARRRRR